MQLLICEVRSAKRIPAHLRRIIWLRGALGLLRRGELRLLLRGELLPVIGVISMLVDLLALRLQVMLRIVSDFMKIFT